MVTLRVPATSANLGAGFDCLGLALSLYNEISMDEADHLSISSTDGTPVPSDESNLVYKTVAHLYKLCGRPLPGLRLIQTNSIPFARGLGSSSACIAGGLSGANALLGNPLGKDDLIAQAALLEGHPDNSSPALLGGLVTAVMEGDKVFYTRQELPDALCFAAIVPDFELKTADARKALPGTVSHTDARFNLGRAALMATSLATGNLGNLAVAAQDRLHQPYRIGLIPKAEAVFDLCGQAGVLASFISGSGSTLLAVFHKDSTDFQQKIRLELDHLGLSRWKLHILQGDNNGTVVAAEPTGISAIS